MSPIAKFAYKIIPKTLWMKQYSCIKGTEKEQLSGFVHMSLWGDQIQNTMREKFTQRQSLVMLCVDLQTVEGLVWVNKYPRCRAIDVQNSVLWIKRVVKNRDGFLLF
jgi:uncharacterized protein (DUF952 family)